MIDISYYEVNKSKDNTFYDTNIDNYSIHANQIIDLPTFFWFDYWEWFDITHCLGTLIWIKKIFLHRDCYSSQIYSKTDWNLLKLKFFDWLFQRKLKNLAKKLSDFDKNLTTKKTICGDLLVKISSKSDNFLAKFLLWNAKGWCDEKNFCRKIFCFEKKFDGTNLKLVTLWIQKLVFSSMILCWVIKINFWRHISTDF